MTPRRDLVESGDGMTHKIGRVRMGHPYTRCGAAIRERTGWGRTSRTREIECRMCRSLDELDEEKKRARRNDANRERYRRAAYARWA